VSRRSKNGSPGSAISDARRLARSTIVRPLEHAGATVPADDDTHRKKPRNFERGMSVRRLLMCARRRGASGENDETK
jgi:hypothetical protein